MRLWGTAAEADTDPDAIPTKIRDWQFFMQAANDGLITKQEALDAVGAGIIPMSMDVLISQIPSEEEQFKARILVRGALDFYFDHPVADLIKALYGWTDEQKADFWRKAGKLT